MGVSGKNEHETNEEQQGLLLDFMDLKSELEQFPHKELLEMLRNSSYRNRLRLALDDQYSLEGVIDGFPQRYCSELRVYFQLAIELVDKEVNLLSANRVVKNDFLLPGFLERAGEIPDSTLAFPIHDLELPIRLKNCLMNSAEFLCGIRGGFDFLKLGHILVKSPEELLQIFGSSSWLSIRLKKLILQECGVDMDRIDDSQRIRIAEKYPTFSSFT